MPDIVQINKYRLDHERNMVVFDAEIAHDGEVRKIVGDVPFDELPGFGFMWDRRIEDYIRATWHLEPRDWRTPAEKEIARLTAERDALRQEVADREKDLQAVSESGYAVADKLQAMRAERDALRTAAQRVVDGIKIHKCVWYDGDEGLYALQGLLDALEGKPVA